MDVKKISSAVVSLVVIVAAIVFFVRYSDRFTPERAVLKRPMPTLLSVSAPKVREAAVRVAPVAAKISIDPNAVIETGPIKNAAALPRGAVSLNITKEGFTPRTFTVSADTPVVLSLTSGDGSSHSLFFENGSLSAVAVGVAAGETRAIAFNAPSVPGTYAFYCDLQGHAERGETGIMTVK